MRRKFLIALGVLVALVAVFAVVVALQPGDYRITRTATIAAPPGDVFTQVNDFHKWNSWSPWAKLDPEAKYTFEGPPAGPGAVFKWSGNDKVGEGTLTITESQPSELIRLKLDFVRPFEDSCNTEFTFKPEGDKTVVSWTMSGTKNFVAKAMCMFMDMDAMVGGDFEKGLASIKSIVETKSQQ